MKISVIIPIYNVENYIEACVNSVRNQSIQDIEIICIHDCGRDHSFEYVEAMAAEDSRIRPYENEKNMGLAATRNKGLQLAKGEYVYFLDSDDMLDEGALQALYEKAEEEQLDAVIFGARFIYDNQELQEKFSSNPARFKQTYPEVLSGKALYKEWMKVWDWMPSQPRFFYRRKFLLENHIRFIDGMVHEDEPFAFDVLMHAKTVRVLDTPYFIRRFRENSIMTGVPTEKNLLGCTRILQHIMSKNDLYEEDLELKNAVNFYRKKITANVRNKFKQTGYPGIFHVKKEMPVLSVIIPVYQVREYIEECLDSVLSQDFLDYEIICVDDASTDGSYEKLLDYKEMDPRIFVYRNEENKGQASARNIGLSHARGTYVYMMDADDYIEKDTLSLLVSLCEVSKLSMIAFENHQFTMENRFEALSQTPLFSYEAVEGIYSGKDAFITCVEEDVISPSVPTYMIKRSCLEENGIRFDENILHEDIGFIFSLFMNVDKVQLLHRALYHRRFRSSSTVTGDFSAKNIEGYLKSWRRAFSYEQRIYEWYGEDERMLHAYRKWIRDVLGRIRMLYLQNDAIYWERGGFVDPESKLLLELLKETTTGPSRGKAILGDDGARKLIGEEKVYLCGQGQYLNRMIDSVGALGVEILGIIKSNLWNLEGRAYRGFPVVDAKTVKEKPGAVVMATSHYNRETYEALLAEYGITDIIYVNF